MYSLSFETIDALSTGHDMIYLYAKSSSARLQKLQALDEGIRTGEMGYVLAWN